MAQMFNHIQFGDMEVPPLETHATNKKHKREVCRYWLHAKCLKGAECEFLHSMDYSKMPICPMGDACTAGSSCFFRHMDPSRDVCANYELGFCSFGRRCPHKHVQKGPEEVPEVSSYFDLENYPATVRAERLSRENKTFRKKVCEYYEKNGWCPYFDMCNFSHSVETK